jgi:hypothetical protein
MKFSKKKTKPLSHLLALCFWLGIGLLSGFEAAAQYYFAEEHWHQGFLIHNDGDTLRGKLRYTLENDAVQLQTSNEQIQTFSARQILYFEFFDTYYKRKRLFIVLPYAKNPGSNYKSPTIFEVLTTGDFVTLLARERLVTQMVTTTSPYVIGPSVAVRRPRFEPFFLYENGEIRPYTDKKDLFRFLPGMDERLHNFIKQNKLNPDEVGDLIKIVNYYNQAIR